MSLATLFITASIKGSLLLALAWGITRTFRRMSAAARHLVWASALGGMLLMPLFMRIVPSVESRLVPALPVTASITTTTTSAPAAAVSAPQRETQATQQPASLAASTAPASAQTNTIDIMALLPLLWGAGAALLLLRLAAGTLKVAVWTRRARPVDDGSWLALVQRLAARLGITRPVTLLRSERACVPMTWGVVYPTVLLPTDADEWTAERRTIVLLHELAHVKRLDAFTQLVAQVATGVFWFNPLVWIAARQMRTEREHACDDCVLQGGARASDYAHDLLQIARSLGGSSAPAAAALAMARRSEFEGRLLAILDPKTDRRSVSRARLAAATLGVMAVALPLAALAPAHVVSPASSPVITRHEAKSETSTPADTTHVNAPQARVAVEQPAMPRLSLPHQDSAAIPPVLSTETMRLMGRMAPVFLDTAVPASTILVVPARRASSRQAQRGTMPPDRETLIAVARAAGKMSSSFEKAELLITIAKYYMPDDELRTLYLDAVSTMTSDYDRSRTLAPLLAKDAALPTKAVAQVVAIASKMTSDFEKANLIVLTVTDGRGLAPDSRSTMIRAIGSIKSGFDRRRALGAFTKSADMTPSDEVELIEMASDISSGFDKAEALIDIATRLGLSDAGVRRAYLKAAETLSSATDYRRVMAGVLK